MFVKNVSKPIFKRQKTQSKYRENNKLDSNQYVNHTALKENVYSLIKH